MKSLFACMLLSSIDEGLYDCLSQRRMKERKMTLMFTPMYNFDVASSLSLPKATCNHKIGIMRIRGPLKIIVSFERSTPWMVGTTHRYWLKDIRFTRIPPL